MNSFLLLAPLFVGVCFGGYDPYADLAQLYRMQLLGEPLDNYVLENLPLDSRAIEESSYWPDLADLEAESGAKLPIYNDPSYSGAHIRDQEHLEHSALHGFQSVSGGTAEGPPNNKQGKSDKQLPAYCNPPNPCPFGKTAEENCVENFENSAENNKKLLSEQECPCDREHMFRCPLGQETVSSKGQKIINQLSKMDAGSDSLENDPFLSSAAKRITQVAKKSPHLIRKRSEVVNYNPYFEGPIKTIAAKKDHKQSLNSFDNRVADWLNSEYGTKK